MRFLSYKKIIQTSCFVFYITRLEIEKQVAQCKKIWDSIVRKTSIVTAQFPKKSIEYTIQELRVHIEHCHARKTAYNNALESRYLATFTFSMPSKLSLLRQNRNNSNVQILDFEFFLGGYLIKWIKKTSIQHYSLYCKIQDAYTYQLIDIIYTRLPRDMIHYQNIHRWIVYL